MTAGTPEGQVFVWDATGLHHPGKAGRLDLLGSYVAGRNALGRHVVTEVVADELALYGIGVPDWCELVALDTLDEVTAFARWTSVLASGRHNLGEASVAAWAEVHSDVAIIDDSTAKSVVARYGLVVHGSLWLLCKAIEAGNVDVTSVSSFVEASRDTKARWPFERFGFRSWALGAGLLSADER